MPTKQKQSESGVEFNDQSVRGDDDAIRGRFVNVVSGPYAGRYGAYASTITYDDSTGLPALCEVFTRDDDSIRIEVSYDDLRPAAPGKR